MRLFFILLTGLLPICSFAQQVIVVPDASILGSLGEVPVKRNGAKNNFMGPTLRLQTSKDFCWGGVGAIVEGGFRQFRGNGTLGFALGNRTGIKGSFEYLAQDLKFKYIASSEREWMQQIAGGLAFQHLFNHSFFRDFDVDGYYSHSWDKGVAGTCVIAEGPTSDFLFSDYRRIAGANAYGVGGKMDFQIFKTTRIGLKVNYDHVDYNTKYSGSLVKAGVGGTAILRQEIRRNVVLDFAASIRKPFNYYTGRLQWTSQKDTGFQVGVFGDYTAGKHRLPSSYDVGLSIGYAFGPKKKMNESGEYVSDCNSQIGPWLVEPAVYMPQVLAVSDEKLESHCRIISGSAQNIFMFSLPIPQDCCIEAFTVTASGGTQNINLYDNNNNLIFTFAGVMVVGTEVFQVPAGIDGCNIGRIETDTVDGAPYDVEITTVCCGDCVFD